MSPCLSDDNDPWDNNKSLATSNPPQAPSDAIDLSNSPLDMDFVPISRCPWCDPEMPTDFEPSAILLALCEELMKVSQPDPTPNCNPDHRRVANTSVFMPHCQHHRLKTNIWPIAQRDRWPRDIDFNWLSDRVKKLQGTLATLLLLDEQTENEFYKPLRASFKPGTSRAAASSASSSYASFNGHNTG